MTYRAYFGRLIMMFTFWVWKIISCFYLFKPHINARSRPSAEHEPQKPRGKCFFVQISKRVRLTLDAFLFFIKAAFIKKNKKKTSLVGFREIGCLAKPISAANSPLRYEKQHTPYVSKKKGLQN